MKNDEHYIKQTFKLARKAQGGTSPNPLAGALIVKNNKIIAQGFHKKAGLAHAEIEAFRKAKTGVAGSTLYVNLEPCYHFGRTGPCVDEIIKRKISRVVFSTLDPNPVVYGKSVKKLKAAGINVTIGILSKEAMRLNEVFFKNMKKNLPFLAAKCAQSLDGKIATRKGVSKWITGDKSRQFSRGLRDRYDCVLAGVNTVLQDSPRLDGPMKVPFKAVLDPDLKIPSNSYLIKNNPQKLIIFTSWRNKNRAGRLPIVAKIFFVKENNGSFDLKMVMRRLYDYGVMSVFIEGGSQTLGSFFDAKLVDKVYFFIAPKIIGGKSALPSVGGKGFASPDDVWLDDMRVQKIGEDVLVTGYPCYRK